MALVILRRFISSVEAAIARSKLASDGIAGFIFDTEDQWVTIGSEAGVRLMVAEEDFANASALLAEVEDGKLP